ncbi:hypothetical protein [Burkholderia pseudomallei]|uniref:hypothetical protein n=1 Tax=Burkholderia pseudomallei TaxID=28450 RepID=UPI0009C99056|nr:hypothetical protein [Burkholderia pseudomallei]OMS96442.1 hypothetical protein AQ750_04715 [Burkholderia pseudomallei]CAJ3485600.1 Uncharacterised protein [Burkholderia pseudomallei]CAJ4174511.1 Uncharacterised protein [Burkholderia pseudomallei]CAJ4616713.1 Uncharacterised protein [Burkholderia pseudomallei]CAJ5599023.1 Uncharacterised protein [Burkholderia pseudomallei]
MRKTRVVLKVVLVVLYVVLLGELGLWLLFGAPPLTWHDWYLAIFPLAAVVFWPGKRNKNYGGIDE